MVLQFEHHTTCLNLPLNSHLPQPAPSTHTLQNALQVKSKMFRTLQEQCIQTSSNISHTGTVKETHLHLIQQRVFPKHHIETTEETSWSEVHGFKSEMCSRTGEQ